MQEKLGGGARRQIMQVRARALHEPGLEQDSTVGSVLPVASSFAVFRERDEIKRVLIAG